MTFQPYPFERLETLLGTLTPNQNYAPLSLTIGEPQFETPFFIQEALCENTALLQKYPKTAGEAQLKEAMLGFVQKRFGVELQAKEIIPTLGTREVLFNFPQFLLFDKESPVMAYTNPFYQIYEGAAIAARAEVVHINLEANNGFKPRIDEEKLKQCDLVILNFPNNPTAVVLDIQELAEWVRLALKHDFVLINDECYSEIYTQEKPPSLLEASVYAGNMDFHNVLVVNSISKRSSAPGLRSGFIAGDAKILQEYGRYRTYVGAAAPLPLQYAAAAAWSNEAHVEVAREHYKKNFALVDEILECAHGDATFYIWLAVEDALAFTCKLYKEYNLKVLPGEFLARTDINGENPGKGYVRIALVSDEADTKDALERIKEALA
jgi:N-succinyldiaminopimelate aminotransferase